MLCGCSLQSRRNTERSSRSCSCQGWTICKVTGLVEAATQEDVPPCRWHWLLGTQVADGSCLVGGLLGVIQHCCLAGLPGCTQPSPAPGGEVSASSHLPHSGALRLSSPKVPVMAQRRHQEGEGGNILE